MLWIKGEGMKSLPPLSEKRNCSKNGLSQKTATFGKSPFVARYNNVFPICALYLFPYIPVITCDCMWYDGITCDKVAFFCDKPFVAIFVGHLTFTMGEGDEAPPYLCLSKAKITKRCLVTENRYFITGFHMKSHDITCTHNSIREKRHKVPQVDGRYWKYRP